MAEAASQRADLEERLAAGAAALDASVARLAASEARGAEQARCLALLRADFAAVRGGAADAARAAAAAQARWACA